MSAHLEHRGEAAPQPSTVTEILRRHDRLESRGQYGWVQSLMFVAYGLGSLALAFAIRSQVTARRGRLGLVLLILSGIGQASAAQFDLHQAALHDLAGALGILCLPLAALLISPALAGTPRWETARKPLLVTANLTWVMVVVWVGTFVLMIATFLQTPGGCQQPLLRISHQA